MRLKNAAITVILTAMIWIVPADATGQGFKVVANETNSADTISKQQLSGIFMKQVDTWSDGRPVIPVDLAANSDTRHEFSEVTFDRDANAIRSYWQRQIFSGRGVPPPEKSTDDEVLMFVRTNPGAIGYVSLNADIGQGVKVLEITKN